MSLSILVVLILFALLVAVGIPLIGTLLKVFLGNQETGGASRGPVTLQCPHCQHKTPAQPPVCTHCGCDL